VYRTVLRNRNFNLYFASRVLSNAGTSISGIAFLLLVFSFTHSSVQTTGVALAETIPYALFGLIGGVAADKLPKKSALVSLDLAQGLILIAGTILYFINELTPANSLIGMSDSGTQLVGPAAAYFFYTG